jgi:murein DD-endopeptidase MepM/ murein hydrolase activator NlpD
VEHHAAACGVTARYLGPQRVDLRAYVRHGDADGTGMQEIAALAQRVARIEDALQTPAPGFSAALAARLAPAQAHVAGAPAAPVTLGEMLRGRFVAPLIAPPPATTLAGAAPPDVPTTDLLKPVDARFTSDFGPRTHPITGRASNHAGVDLAAPTGTPIAAAGEGVVAFAGVRGGYGNLVILEHADGTQTYYAHADRLDVRAGDRVARGQQVATVGSTGRSTGPHLHFEVRRDGVPVDPAPLIGLP